MRRNNWPVEKHGIRPNGPPDECFYCRSKEGAQHRMGCVIRERTVVIRTTVEHTVAVPEDWERETIEFTEGSSCSDNHIDRLAELVDRLDKAGECTCGMLHIEYVREANTEDEKQSRLFIEGAES